MICIRLEGGLGNQLFQYAAGRALAVRHSAALLLDTTKFSQKKRGVTSRVLNLNHFSHVARIATNREMRFLPWLSHLPVLSGMVSSWNTYLENGPGFDAGFLSLPDQSYLVGYWQSFRYFENIAPQLIGEFEPVERLSPANEALLDKVGAEKSVAVHVRRGDYLTLKSAARLHGVQPISYYANALERVRERVEAPEFVVFSDDPKWCRDKLPLESGATFVDNNAGSDAWQDLVLMSHCRHHVIANSSLSWWGAWLADQRWSSVTRVVIAPARWFAGHAEQNLVDRFPPHWLVQS